MKNKFGIKDQLWMSLFDKNRKNEKIEVSEVPQDLTVSDAPKKVGRPSETEVCFTRYGEISRPEYHGSKSLACGVQPLDTLTTSSGPILVVCPWAAFSLSPLVIDNVKQESRGLAVSLLIIVSFILGEAATQTLLKFEVVPTVRVALSILAIMTIMLVFWVREPSIKEPCSIRSS